MGSVTRSIAAAESQLYISIDGCKKKQAARRVLRGLRRAAAVHSRVAISMVAVYCAELTFKALDDQQEFFVAETLG